MFLSKSAMNCFKVCPRKFQELYVLKNRSNITTWQMQRGLEFHDFANYFYDHIKFIDETLYVDDVWLEKFKSNCIEETIPYIDNFIKFELDRLEICKHILPDNPIKMFMPLMREAKFVSESLKRITIIDRIDLRPDGNYTLVEYKTEAYSEKNWKRSELRAELAFEKSVPEKCPEFTEKFKGKFVDFVVYYPKSNDVWVEKFNFRSINAMEKTVTKIREFVSQNHYPCEVSFLCKYCDLAPKCPMTFTGRLRI